MFELTVGLEEIVTLLLIGGGIGYLIATLSSSEEHRAHPERSADER